MTFQEIIKANPQAGKLAMELLNSHRDFMSRAMVKIEDMERFLRTLEGECPSSHIIEPFGVSGIKFPANCTSNNGKVSLMTIWEARV